MTVAPPAAGLEDALDVWTHIARIFGAAADGRAAAIRRLFAETLDFNPDRGQVDLRDAPATVELPDSAERIAELEGVQVVYVPLETPAIGRVRKADVTEAARLIERQLGDDLLLVVANAAGDQLHLVLPDLTGTRPMLRRLVFERGEHNRTPVEQLSKIYRGPRDTRSVRVALTEAFDVEPVTKRFFQEYKRVFEQVEQSVTGFAGGEDDERRLFVQTLFNRLMFVYFLQRKGWLKFRGDTDYLKALWSDYRQSDREGDNFHLSRLRILFFAGLNNPASRDVTAGTEPLIGEVQFLNGGLFEQGALDNHGVTVPDDAVEAVLTELFDRFNFTVMESTPFDIEVAVDPEMLGKVFEELVTGRHESGSYYTPRPVVSFMCREALKGYLEGVTTLESEPIRLLVDEHDASSISLAHAQAVAGALDEVTIVDPACGSGAYLLGMMQELVELWAILYSDRLKHDARSLYDLKLHIIERNLYGADIDKFAVNIAMLRMWLSLAIEYEDDSHVAPLPNLDFKVMCGDSLLAPDPSTGVAAREAPSAQMALGRDPARMEELDALKGAYMRESLAADKERLHNQIDDIREELREGIEAAAEDTLDWRVEFAEVFATRGGFDIAIANPPYERHEQIRGHKANLRMLYPDVYTGTADYYVYFYNRAVQSLRDGGILAFISSNKYMRAAYGKKLRAYLSTQLTVTQVVDFGDLPVFTANAYPSVIVGRKAREGPSRLLQVADLVPPIRREVAARGLPVTTDTVNRAIDGLPELLARHAVSDYPRSMLGEDGWVLEDIALVRLFERLMNTGTPLGEFVKGRIYYGVKTGLNEAFVIDRGTRDELLAADPRSDELIKPWLRGRDIKRWRVDWRGQYIIAIQNSGDASARNPWAGAASERSARAIFGEHYPALHDHVSRFENALRARSDQGKFWWELRACAYYPQFDRPKIIFNRFINAPTFALDTSGFYHNDACYFAVPPTPALAAIVNSEIGWWLLWRLCTILQNGYLQVFIQFLERLPVPPIPDTLDQRLSEHVMQATSGDLSPTLESELNDLVYDLYGLVS